MGVDATTEKQLVRCLDEERNRLTRAEVVVISSVLGGVGNPDALSAWRVRIRSSTLLYGLIALGLPPNLECRPTVSVQVRGRAARGNAGVRPTMRGLTAEFEIDAYQTVALGRVRRDEQHPSVGKPLQRRCIHDDDRIQRGIHSASNHGDTP